MLYKKHLLITAIISCFAVINCLNNKTPFIECDPQKSSGEKPIIECPQNAQCVELGPKNGQMSTNILQYGGLCACKYNFTVNKNYSSLDDKSQYCISNNVTNSTEKPAIQTEKSTSSTQKAPTPTENPPPTQAVKATAAPKALNTTVATVQPANKTETLSTAKPSSSESHNNTNDNNHDKQQQSPIPTPQQQQQQQKNENANVSPQTHHILGGVVVPVLIVLAFIGLVYGIRKYDVLDRAQNYIRNRRNGGTTHQTRYDGLENDFDDDPLLI